MIKPKIDHTGKVILVTGPAGNLGAAVVERFLEEDTSLILPDRDPDRIFERYPALAASPRHLLIPGVDLMDIGSIQAAVNSALDVFGRIDCLVHTVGGFHMGEMVHEIDAQNWERMMDINVKTLLNMVKATFPVMVDQKDGMIITIGARPSLEGKKNMGSYSAAKAAVLRLTESLAKEGKSSGISARCVIPGTIDTAQNRRAMPDSNTKNWVKPAYLAEIIYQLCNRAYTPDENVIIPVYKGKK